jgi:heme-degrading monooxygenase HmoA
MYALTTRVFLPADTDWEAMRAVARERAQLYEGVPGLRTKALVLDPAQRAYGGLYIWESREALDAFLASDLFQAAVQKFGGAIEIRIYEVPALLEGGAVVAAES